MVHKSKRPNWQDIAHVERALVCFNEQRGCPGEMPTEKELKENDLGGLAGAIYQYHGAFKAVGQELGLYSKRKPNDYYAKFSVLREELLAYIAENGEPGIMPTTTQLKSDHRTDLKKAIRKHGGMRIVADELELKLSSNDKPHGYWNDFANVKRAVRTWIRENDNHGVLPTHNQLIRSRNSGLGNAIQKWCGYPKVARRMGLRSVRRANHSWTKRVIDREVRAFIDEYGTADTMPTDTELRNEGRSDLANAISRNGGGFRDTAKRLKLAPRQPTPDGWWTVSRVDSEVQNFIRSDGNSGMMPTQAELIEAGRRDLVNALYRISGGAAGVRKRLGLKASRVPNGYWDDPCNIERHLLVFIESVGVRGLMPTKDELWATDEKRLARAIEEKLGGFPAAAEQFGLVPASDLEWTSRDEIILAHELLAFIDFDVTDHQVTTGGRKFKCDIVIRDLRLIVEFDGCYYHRDRVTRDKEKTKRLEAGGWRVIRVRQEPLRKISRDDVIVPAHDHKTVANRVLRKIEVVCGIQLPGLDLYLESDALRRMDSAMRHIEDSITKKGERRQTPPRIKA